MNLQPLNTLDGGVLPPSTFEGKAILFVNVASECGLTSQYAGLQALHESTSQLIVIGVPCNQFGGQEPGTPEEIAAFCSSSYGVSFPLLQKQDVNGPARSPLYQALVGSEVGANVDIEWNFCKFLVNPKGEVVARFHPTKAANSPEIVAAIAELS